MLDKIKQISKSAYTILRRKLSYQDCFCDAAGNLTVSGDLVMRDLMKFCNARSSTFYVNMTGTSDPYITAFNEGKRAVYNRIMHYCKLDEKIITKLYQDTEE